LTASDKSLNSLGLLADALPQGVLVFDLCGNLLLWNQHFARMYGNSDAFIATLQYAQLFRSASAPLLWLELIEQPNGSPHTQRDMLTHRNGRQVPVLLGAACVDLGEVRAVVLGITDLSEQHAAELHLLHRVYFDPLTHLPNRAGFRRDLAALGERRAHTHAQRVVAVLDIDRFRAVNDSLGYEGGNARLRDLAQRLQWALPEAELFGHLGEDEFALVFADICDEGQARQLGLRLLELFHQPFETRGERLTVTASVGIAPAQGDDAGIWMCNADTALYSAKEAGASQVVVYDRAMRDSNELRLRMETELRKALQRGELHMFFQPIVELASGRLVGHEALARWNSPLSGPISPAEFIPLAERAGMAPALDAWVLRQVIAQLQQSPAASAINVNVSALTLIDTAWVDEALALFAQARLAPGRLRMEITETALLSHQSAARANIERINHAGLPIILDDFGTGFSSLSHLLDYPIAGLKIDRSFVERVDSNSRELRIVVAMSRLADDLGLSVTAEGVESEAQHTVLLAAGCRYGQGHYYGRPRPWSDAIVSK